MILLAAKGAFSSAFQPESVALTVLMFSVVAAAGLQERTLSPADGTYCNGEFTLGKWRFGDWLKGGHGHVNLRSSIVHSCNVFFYQAGLKVGPDAIARYARAFGLGAPSGIDLSGERPGLVPSPDWKRARLGRSWTAGETLNVAIGQGQLLVTPLQVARMMSAFANRGVLWKPRLVQRVERADGTLAYSEATRMTGQVDLSPPVWEFLRQAMAGVGVGLAVSVPLAVGVSALEIIVVLVQAYVFALLTAVFIGMAINVHH